MAADGLRTDKIWMDGGLVPYDQANVHILTHSLHYGLAVFEGMRCYKGADGRSAIFRGREHIRRLFDSAHIVEMPLPFSQEEILKASSFTRYHHNSLPPNAKLSGPYVNSILAGYEARRHGYDEALLLDVTGFVAEGSGENFFIVRDGVIRTPPLTSSLPGITRASVIKILDDLKIPVVEQLFPRDAVYIADEAFMTGTAAEVTPVRELDDRQIGEGKPGPITRKVMEVFQAALHGRDSRYSSWLYYV